MVCVLWLRCVLWLWLWWLWWLGLRWRRRWWLRRVVLLSAFLLRQPLPAWFVACLLSRRHAPLSAPLSSACRRPQDPRGRRASRGPGLSDRANTGRRLSPCACQLLLLLAMCCLPLCLLLAARCPLPAARRRLPTTRCRTCVYTHSVLHERFARARAFLERPARAGGDVHLAAGLQGLHAGEPALRTAAILLTLSLHFGDTCQGLDTCRAAAGGRVAAAQAAADRHLAERGRAARVC